MKFEFWCLVFVLGISTFGIRWSFLSIAGSWRVHPLLESMMKFIPAAVFAALSVPALIFIKSESYSVQPMDRLIAGAIAAVVAYFSCNVLFTILSGLGALWLFRFLG